MKKRITYKAITVAIGILVAMVIALTIWLRNPVQAAGSAFPARPQASVPIFVKKLLDTTLPIFTAVEAAQENQ